jgi:hypothetical protein
MNAMLKEIMQRAEKWSENDQQELALLAGQSEVRRQGYYLATAEELKALDEALEAAKRGDFATDAEVEALFAKYRRS